MIAGLGAVLRGRRAALAAALWAIATLLGHLPFSLWLVAPRAPAWGLDGPWAWRDALPAVAVLGGLGLALGLVRLARAQPDPARRLAWVGQVLAWLAAFWAVDRWLTFSLAEWIHLPQYALLAVLLARAWDPDRQAWPRARLMLLATGVGAFDELLQYLWTTASYSHYLDFNDILVNALAAWLGLLLHYGAATPPPARRARPRGVAPTTALLAGLALLASLALATGRLQAHPAPGNAAPGGLWVQPAGSTVFVLARAPGFHGHWRPSARQDRHWVLPPGLGLGLTAVVLALGAWPGPRRPRAWGPALASAGGGLGLAVALAARALGHPRCPGDEQAWVQIHLALAQGLEGPVSGPGHVLAVQALQALGLGPAAALAWLGVASTALAGAAWPLILAAARAPSVLGALAVLLASSHAWAPWLESRPQQLGQVAVAALLVVAWRRLAAGRAPGLALALGAAAVAGWHLLSYGLLLLGWAGLLLGARLAGVQARPARAWVLAPASGLLLLAWPGGPYTAMLHDLADHHLPPPAVLAGLAVLPLAAAALAILARGRIAPAAWQAPAEARAARRGRPGRGALAALAGLALAGILVQAALLPAEAWQPYGGSPGRLLLAQAGNLLGLGLVAAAAGRLLTGWPGMGRPARRRALAWGAAAGLSLGVALMASAVMLHSNWLLRAWAYVLPWLAPAAGGLLASLVRRAPWAMLPALLLAWASALVATLRPPGWLGC